MTVERAIKRMKKVDKMMCQMVDIFVCDMLGESMPKRGHKGSKGNKPGKSKKTKMKRSVDKSKEGVRWKSPS